jgi:sulfur relay (sulfurtransferase) complex TusBCD TusD component (DsrE family)
MASDTVMVFTRYGLGSGPDELQKLLAGKFLSLLDESGNLPAKILFYTEGVKLACEGSPVLDPLRALQAKGVELILCQTCLDYFGLTECVTVGIVGGMPDIIETLQKAGKVISL